MSVQESDAAFCRGGRSGKRPGRKSILERVSQHSSQYYRKNTCRVDAGPPVSNSAVSAPAGSTARREEAAAGETSSSGQVLKWRSCLHSQLNRRVKWIPGRITSSVGTRMFNVQCADGVHRRHVDQMRHRVKVLPTY